MLANGIPHGGVDKMSRFAVPRLTRWPVVRREAKKKAGTRFPGPAIIDAAFC